MKKEAAPRGNQATEQNKAREGVPTVRPHTNPGEISHNSFHDKKQKKSPNATRAKRRRALQPQGNGCPLLLLFDDSVDDNAAAPHAV